MVRRMICPKIFQSTPPIRVATWAAGQMLQAYLISIHATHTGGDKADGDVRRIDQFQSTPPIRVATARV